MNAKDFALELRRALSKVLQEGHGTVETRNVIAYLDEAVSTMEQLPLNPSEADLELYKANLQKWVEEHKNFHAQNREMFRSVIASGQNALRTAFLMNGGGAIAILSFVGTLAINSPQRVAPFASTLAMFVTGVLLVAAAAGSTYLSQLFYTDESSLRAGKIFHAIAILLPILSYVTFAWGVYKAYLVFAAFT